MDTESTSLEKQSIRFSMRSHLLTLLMISLPLALSQLSEMAMSTTDTILLGGLGVSAVATGGLSNNFFMSTMVTCQCILGGMGVLLAQSRGEKDHGKESEHKGREIVSAGFLLAVLIFVPAFVLLVLSGHLFAWMNEPLEVISDGSQYIHILLWSLLPDLAFIGVCRVAFPALGSEKILLWIMPLMAFVNGLFNYALIYGKWGFPALGLLGSAWASSITAIAISLLLVLCAISLPSLRHVMILGALRIKTFLEVSRLGIPMMCAAACEILLFQITTLRAGQLGTQSLAAHQVALNTSSLLFMVCLSIGQAVNIRVAYWNGAGLPKQVKKSIFSALALVLIWTFSTGICLIFFGDEIAKCFFMGKVPDTETLNLTTKLLMWAGIFQIVDGIQTVTGGALRGCGDAVGPLLIGLVSYILVGLGFGSYLAFHSVYGVTGLWIGLAAALAATSVMFSFRLYRVVRRLSKLNVP
ncbi:MATE family efflux transporter [Acetobacteraceae bacterium]|nr:MATE family efflux transporter [Acetobacteraceae bacterium]